jgi:hypothetical protein
MTAVAVIAISAAQAVDTSSNPAEAEGVTVTGEANQLTFVGVPRGLRKAEDPSSGSFHSQDGR